MRAVASLASGRRATLTVSVQCIVDREDGYLGSPWEEERFGSRDYAAA